MKKTSIRFALLFFFFTFSFSLFTIAQPPNLDSLYSVWQDQTQPDTLRARAFERYIWNRFLFSNPDTANILADELIAFAKKMNDPGYQADGINLKGISNFIKGDYPKALDYYTQCLNIYEQMGDQKGIGASLGNFGMIYAKQGDYPKALDYHTQSLNISEQLGDKAGMVSSLDNIGGIYSMQGDYLKALDYSPKG